MISQSTRFNVAGEQAFPHSPVETLSYSNLPTSPQTRNKHAPEPAENNTPVNFGNRSERYVFTPHKDDTVQHRFRLRYSPCSDAYQKEWNDCVLTTIGGNVRGWDKGVYSFESVERVMDAKKNLVYLERTPGSTTGILTWKMDFSSCGLVVDQVSIKVFSHPMNGGDALVMLSSDTTKKSISHMEGLGVANVDGFENSKILLLSIHLIGETPQQQTRLFEKDILSKGDFPLDVKITLKPPAKMYNQPVILLGLMFSNTQERSVDRRHYRSHSNSTGKGFLHLNVVQAKNISSAKDSVPEAQVKCYLLPDDRNLKSCKTGRAKKSSSPVWDEYFVIDGVAQSELRKKQLGVRVVNWHLGFNKKNCQLGELRVGSANVFNFQTLASPTPAHCAQDFQLSNGRPGNESAVSSPLLRVEEDPSCLNRAKMQGNRDEGGDEEWLRKETNVVAENLKGPCSVAGHREDSDNNENITSSVPPSGEIKESDEPSQSLCNGHNRRREVDSPFKPASQKPPRPPPPNLLKLNDRQPRNSETSFELSGEDESRLLVSPRRVQTPTLSRLMMKLPVSPRRGRRRSSWGGESDLSIESPRSARTPDVFESLESRQWDLMISKPKQWIYCWQSLEVNISE